MREAGTVERPQRQLVLEEVAAHECAGGTVFPADSNIEHQHMRMESRVLQSRGAVREGGGDELHVLAPVPARAAARDGYLRLGVFHRVLNGLKLKRLDLPAQRFISNCPEAAQRLRG